MAQITTGIRRTLSMPAAYSALQNLIGAKLGRKILCQEYIPALPADAMVDIGYWPDQSRAARFIIGKYRGQNVRTGDVLAAPIFARIELIRRDEMLNIPYTHATLECPT